MVNRNNSKHVCCQHYEVMLCLRTEMDFAQPKLLVVGMDVGDSIKLHHQTEKAFDRVSHFKARIEARVRRKQNHLCHDQRSSSSTVVRRLEPPSQILQSS